MLLNLTLEKFRLATASTQSNAEKYYPFIEGACLRYNINTKLRLAAFLAQISHESAGLSTTVENLNYSQEALMKVWPKRFPSLDSAKPYHRNPEKIANKVYADRMGNGNEQSADGWRYRGRGLKQLTGKYNYKLLSDSLQVDFVSNPDLLLHPLWAVISAAWFWDNNNCNCFADKGDMIGLTKKINGGTIGLDDRLKRYKTAMQVLEQV